MPTIEIREETDRPTYLSPSQILTELLRKQVAELQRANNREVERRRAGRQEGCGGV